MPEGDIPLFTPPVDKFHRARALSRSIFHIIHLLIAFFLFFVILAELSERYNNPLLLYLAPIILVILVTNAFNLFRPAPVFNTSRLGIFNSLRGRGFIYQASGALIVADGNCSGLLIDIAGALVWITGVVLFLLGVLAHDFGLEDWEEPITLNAQESTDLPTPTRIIDHPRRIMAVSRYIIHIIHLLIALLFTATIILTFCTRRTPYFLSSILYLIPLIIIILAIELCYIFLQMPPKRLTDPLGDLNTLWGRGFIYQAAGALVMTVTRISGCHQLPMKGPWRESDFDDPLLDVAWILGIIAWGIGLLMFIFGIFVPRFELNDWVEEPKRQGIYLEPSDTEEANVGFSPDGSE